VFNNPVGYRPNKAWLASHFKAEVVQKLKFLINGGCSKTSVLKQQPLKNAVLQGFSLKNCKSLAKTNRVLEQAQRYANSSG
jgi:hypothetical protein